ncbi:MAG: iron ABC transporter permease [Candidatus Planktophila sp.]|jgi:iron(III) transport system permease protein|nr:iron ABC transporter permease [Candidatus Planktophila sp.]
MVKSGSYGLRALVAGVLIAISQPLLYLIIRAGEKPAGDILALLTRSKTVEVLGATVLLLSAVVAINVLLGTALAAGLHYIEIPYPRILLVMTVLPLAIPSYVFTYTWKALVPSLDGIWAATFILVLTTMPYMILAVTISFQRIDSGLIEVSRSLGLTKPAVFFRVILPQVRRSISAGALLSGLYVLSDFGAVSLLNVETLTVSIQNLYKSSYDRSAASVIGLLLFLAAAIFVSMESFLKGREFESRGAEGFQQQIRRVKNLPLSVVTTFVLGLYTFLAVVIPFYVLISRFLQNPAAVAISDLTTAAISTITVAAMGAAIAFLLSLPLAFLMTQGASTFGSISEKIILMAHALPGVVVGLALVSFGSRLGVLYQSIFLLAFAYAVLFLAKSVASTSSALSLVSPQLKEVAATLGKSKSRVTMEVVFPIALPNLALGVLLVFLTAMKELPATLMLRPTGMDTLATEVWSFAAISRFNEAAPYALLLVLLAAIPTFILTIPRSAKNEASVKAKVN